MKNKLILAFSGNDIFQLTADHMISYLYGQWSGMVFSAAVTCLDDYD